MGNEFNKYKYKYKIMIPTDHAFVCIIYQIPVPHISAVAIRTLLCWTSAAVTGDIHPGTTGKLITIIRDAAPPDLAALAARSVGPRR